MANNLFNDLNADTIQDKANDFDFVIVVLSIVEFLAEGAKGLSMLRSFRLLRVFKLAKSWKSLNDILTIMKGTVASISNLIVVLCIIIFIFAVMGMQLFGAAYTEDVCKWDGCVGPRWHFKDFFHRYQSKYQARSYSHVFCSQLYDRVPSVVR